jgi:hypothetical protein
MIATSSFAPTKQSLFRLLLMRYFQKKWWLYALILACGIFSIPVTTDHDYYMGVALIACGVILPLVVCYRFWNGISSPENKVLYLPRYYEFDQENIRIFHEDGSTSSTKTSTFVKWEFFKGQYLLYMTKTQYLLIPASAFKSQGDLNWFNTHVLGKISMPGFL